MVAAPTQEDAVGGWRRFRLSSERSRPARFELSLPTSNGFAPRTIAGDRKSTPSDEPLGIPPITFAVGTLATHSERHARLSQESAGTGQSGGTPPRSHRCGFHNPYFVTAYGLIAAPLQLLPHRSSNFALKDFLDPFSFVINRHCGRNRAGAKRETGGFGQRRCKAALKRLPLSGTVRNDAGGRSL